MSAASQETIERLKEQAAAETETEEDDEVEPEEEPEAKPKKESKREYIVFQQGTKDEWVEITRATAGSAAEAIETLGEHLKNGTRYGATPSRNWHEKTAEVETTTSIKLK